MADEPIDPRPPRPAGYSATPGLPQATPDPPPPPRARGGNGRREQYDESPSQAIIAAGRRVVNITDSLGRRLLVRYITGRDRMLLFKVLGPELVKNDYYLGYATLAWAVIELDNGSGEDPRIPPMVKPSEIEFLVDRLGEEGLAAVGEVYRTHFISQVEGPDIDAAKN